jgi:hypothetical protein
MSLRAADGKVLESTAQWQQFACIPAAGVQQPSSLSAWLQGHKAANGTKPTDTSAIISRTAQPRRMGSL